MFRRRRRRAGPFRSSAVQLASNTGSPSVGQDNGTCGGRTCRPVSDTFNAEPPRSLQAINLGQFCQCFAGVMFRDLAQGRAKLLRLPIRPAALGTKSPDQDTLGLGTVLLFPDHSQAFSLKRGSAYGHNHRRVLCRAHRFDSHQGRSFLAVKLFKCTADAVQSDEEVRRGVRQNIG